MKYYTFDYENFLEVMTQLFSRNLHSNFKIKVTCCHRTITLHVLGPNMLLEVHIFETKLAA
jgi:hypothetical protein